MNSSHSSGPINRARQSDQHLALKEKVGAALTRRGFEVLYEHNLADVVAYHLDRGIVIVVEVELSARNLASNLTRNLASGFRHIFIVAPGEQEAVLYEWKLSGHPAVRNRSDVLRIVTPDRIEDSLDKWLSDKAAEKNSGNFSDPARKSVNTVKARTRANFQTQTKLTK